MQNTSDNTFPRLVYLVTSAGSLRFLRGQLTFMRERGFDVYLVSSPGPELDRARTQESVNTKEIPISREIHPLRDLIALYRLVRLCRQLRPAILVAGTPKAGLLGMLAAWLTRVPVRVYMLHGLRLETTTGLKRVVLSVTERLASACSTSVICVSESLRQIYVRLRLTSREKTSVLEGGSANGIETDHFRPLADDRSERASVRELMNIPMDAPVVGYAGRLTYDKGIVELLQAFKCVLEKIPDVWLLLVGDIEDGDPVPDTCIRELMAHPQIAISPFVEDPLPYYHAMDVLAYASHREGLGLAPLEAAATELPVAAFHATGTVDSVEDGVTGTLTPVGDHIALADAVVRYFEDADLRARHGKAGRRRVLREFDPELVRTAYYEHFTSLLRATGKREPCLDLARPFDSSNRSAPGTTAIQ